MMRFASTIFILCLTGMKLLSVAAAPVAGKVVAQNSTDSNVAKMTIYVPCSGNASIYQYQIGKDGSLQALSPPFVAAGGGYSPYIVTGQHRQYAYGFDSKSHIILQYRITDSGILLPLSPPGEPVGKGDSGNVYLTPDGHFAYCPNINDNTLSQFKVQPDGRLKTLIPPTVATGKGPLFLASVKSNYLYCADTDDGTITSYKIATDGKLLPLAAPIRTNAEPIYLQISDDYHTLYSINWLPGSISQFHIGEDGHLTEMGPSLKLSAGVSGDFLLHPATHSAYVTDAGRTIFQYRINTDGSLSPLSPAKVVLPGGPASHLAISEAITTPTGSRPDAFLYANLQFTRQIAQFRINSDGTLSALSPEAVDDSEGAPQSLSTDPTGSFVYVTNDRSDQISQFRVSNNGQLVPLSPRSAPGGFGFGLISTVTLPSMPSATPKHTPKRK